MNGPEKVCHIVVSGRVQGVGFRQATLREAGKLRLKGWVRNTRDGDVEIEVAGPETDLEKFVQWCGRGPSFAAVSKVAVTFREERTLSVTESFEILSTA